MSFFSKKLTSEQENEVKEFSSTLHSVCIPCVHSWRRFIQEMYELMLICQSARMNESDPVGVKKLIKPALKSATQYRDVLENARTRFNTLEIRDWFPKELRNEIETWASFLEGQLKPLSMVIQSISPPNPLRTWAGEGGAKLNMFVSGMNIIAMVRHLDVVTKNLGDD